MTLSVLQTSPGLGLLAMLAAHGGRIENRITIQKLAFLLKQKGEPAFQRLAFVYHFYGPYSRDLSAVLQDLVVFGLVDEQRTDFAPDSTRYSYVLTLQGREYLRSAGCDVGSLSVMVEVGLQEHWRTLELAATTLFLEKDKHLTRDCAQRKALDLKPACAPYAQQAETVLSKLGL